MERTGKLAFFIIKSFFMRNSTIIYLSTYSPCRFLVITYQKLHITGFGDGSVSGFLLEMPKEAVGIDLEKPCFTFGSDYNLCQDVKSISVNKFNASTETVDILVSYDCGFLVGTLGLVPQFYPFYNTRFYKLLIVISDQIN